MEAPLFTPGLLHQSRIKLGVGHKKKKKYTTHTDNHITYALCEFGGKVRPVYSPV